MEEGNPLASSPADEGVSPPRSTPPRYRAGGEEMGGEELTEKKKIVRRIIPYSCLPQGSQVPGL